LIGNEKDSDKAFKKTLKRQASREADSYQHKKLRKAMKKRPMLIFDKAFKMFLFIVIMASTLCNVHSAQVDPTLVSQPQDHHVIFEKVGDMASNMAYIHVTFAVNISNLYDRADVLGKFIKSNLQNKGLQDQLSKIAVNHMPNIWTGWASFDIKHGERPFSSMYKDIFTVAWNKLELVLADLVQLVQKLPPMEGATIPDIPTRIDTLIGKAAKFKLARPETVFLGGRHRRAAKLAPPRFRLSSTTSTTSTTETPTTSATPDEPETISPPPEVFTRFVDIDKEPEAIIGTNMEAIISGLGSPGQREKRWAPLALAAGAAILGTFFGLFNQREINRLAGQMNNIKTASNVLVQVTNQHEVELGILQNEVTSLTKIIGHLVRQSPEVLEASLDFAIMELKDQVDLLKSTFQMLQFHRLSSDLVNGLHLVDMHKRLHDMAVNNGYKLLPKIPSDYFQLETSYVREKDDLLVILHVPCVSGEQDLSIYRYVPYPFPLPGIVDNFRNTTIAEVFDPEWTNLSPRPKAPAKPEALFIKTEATFLAMGKNQQYKLLSDAEFGLCTKKSNYYLCEEHQVVGTDLTNTCIGSLYLRSLEGVRVHCKFERRPLQEQVFQLSPTEHLIYSPKIFTTQIICINGTHFPLPIYEHSRIEVPQGCHVKLKNHIITSDVTLRAPPTPLRVTWKWNPLSLPSNLLHDIGIMDEQFGRLQDEIAFIRNYTSSPEYIRPIAKNVLDERHMFNWTWYVVLGLIGLLIFLVIAGFLLAYRCRHRLTTLCQILGRRPSPPPPESFAMSRHEDDIEPPSVQRNIRREHDCRYESPPTRRSSRHRSFHGSYSSLPKRQQRGSTSTISSTPGSVFDLPKEPWGDRGMT